jgi:hypothetical protein
MDETPPGDGAPAPARVTRTGLAVIHEGEVILPAAGSEAGLEQAAGDKRSELRFVFPVEIDVRGGHEPADVDAIADATLRRLALGLRST